MRRILCASHRRVLAALARGVLIVAGLMGISAHATAANARLLVGAGMYDITGPAAESGMFGFAAEQTVDGIKQRLWARAFILVDAASGKRVVFVSCDLGAVFQSEKLAVMRLLKQRFGTLYDASNVMITANHTHVGSGGQSHLPLYITASMDNSGAGYSSQAFQAAVQGITEAIARAHQNLAPGTVQISTDSVNTLSRNRSELAYSHNHDRNPADPHFNNQMTVLKFFRDDGKPVGMVNWFALHATSFSKNYTKLSGDNKGYASYAFERRMNGVTTPNGFVAAFANSDEGDTVPLDGSAYGMPGYVGSADEEANVLAAGGKQFDKGLQIYAMPGTNIGTTIDYRHQWINFPQYVVSRTYTGTTDQQLCRAGLGFSFAAGAPNGPSDVPGFQPGMTVANTNIQTAFEQYKQSVVGGMALTVLQVINPAMADPCQSPKPVMLATGSLGLTPEILPVQLFRIGSLAVVGLPFEITTMSGRHIRARVQEQLAAVGVNQVVIAGLANSYAGYMATYAEFQVQHYEGASTHFGPHQSAAVQQMVATQARAMASGAPLADTGTPPDRTNALRTERPGVVLDDKYAWENFGQVLLDVQPSYSRGATVTVKFRAGHPKNNLRTMDSFLLVQMRDPGTGDWKTVATDHDFETTYQWQREGAARSVVTITWKVPAGSAPGIYRIVHQGDWKNGWTGVVSPYTGTSNLFRVL